MAERLYIETTFVSYLTARISRDLIVAGHQQITQEWWDKRRGDFEVYISQLVLQEASVGDPLAAQARLDVLTGLPLLNISDSIVSLAEDLLRAGAMPEKAGNDAMHIAIAAVHHIPYLLTWNCRHMANAAMRPMIESICSRKGYIAPIICTPEVLMGAKK